MVATLALGLVVVCFRTNDTVVQPDRNNGMTGWPAVGGEGKRFLRLICTGADTIVKRKNRDSFNTPATTRRLNVSSGSNLTRIGAFFVRRDHNARPW